MRVDLICISLVLYIARSASSATPTDPFLGISPQGEEYYRSSDTIACRDGSNKFTRAQLNDDFCDCLDGTDEPGTSACPRGKFICRNAGHAPLKIFSSRVNDGLCDCCDGSDEYDGMVKCPNTCWEAGTVARDKLKKKIATYEEGVDIRRHGIEQAKVTLADDEAELSKLKKERKILKGIVEQLKDRKEEIKEKEKKEAEEKVRHKEADSPVESRIVDEIGVVVSDQHAATSDEKAVSGEESKKDSAATDLDSGSKDKGPMDELKKVEESENTEGLSSEELGRLVASRWTGESSVKQSNTAKDNHHPEDDNDMEDKTREDSSSNQADELDSGETSNSLTWWEKIRKTALIILKAFKTPVDISEAEQVSKEYEESSAKLSEMKSRISNLTEKLKLDFGPEKEFFSFYDRCFEGKQNKYVYKVCPYKNATQLEGHTTTRLGNWGKFEDAYKVMVFLKGDKCDNGPDRSLKIKLRCGLKNEITDIDEPSRCEYVAQLATPVLCSEEKLKEFQDKLDDMTKGF